MQIRVFTKINASISACRMSSNLSAFETLLVRIQLLSLQLVLYNKLRLRVRLDGERLRNLSTNAGLLGVGLEIGV